MDAGEWSEEMTYIVSDTVLVLGAGFTKAFLPDAPLLVEDEIRNSYRRIFPDISDDRFMFDGALIWANQFVSR